MCPVLSIGQPEPINCKLTDCEWFRGGGTPNDPGLCSVADIAGWLSALSNLAGDTNKPTGTTSDSAPIPLFKTGKPDE